MHSGTCIRQSPLRPDQVAIIQWWPAYRVCIKIKFPRYYMVKWYKLQFMWLVSLTSSFAVMVTWSICQDRLVKLLVKSPAMSGLHTFEDIMSTKVFGHQLLYQRNTAANHRTYQLPRSLRCDSVEIWLQSRTHFKDSQPDGFLFP